LAEILNQLSAPGSTPRPAAYFLIIVTAHRRKDNDIKLLALESINRADPNAICLIRKLFFNYIFYLLI
jgi:hypothetical protein